MGNEIFRQLARLEEGLDDDVPAWLGSTSGTVVAVFLTFAAAGLTALLSAVGLHSGMPGLTKLCLGISLATIVAVAAFWLRQRLAAHAQAAERLLASPDPDERQRGLTELMTQRAGGRRSTDGSPSLSAVTCGRRSTDTRASALAVRSRSRSSRTTRWRCAPSAI